MTPHRPFPRVLIVVILALASLASSADAQSLGAVARESASRRGTPAGGKVYTNANLPDVPPPPAAAAPAAASPAQAPAAQAPGAAAAPAAGTTKPDAAVPEAKKDEAYWRGRMKTIREAKSRAESFAEALQSRINALSADFVNRDDPAQRGAIAADRQKALDELARVQKEIQQHTKAMADLQTEARRAGVPPGWLR